MRTRASLREERDAYAAALLSLDEDAYIDVQDWFGSLDTNDDDAPDSQQSPFDQGLDQGLRASGETVRGLTLENSLLRGELGTLKARIEKLLHPALAEMVLETE